jgi:gluconokinase
MQRESNRSEPATSLTGGGAPQCTIGLDIGTTTVKALAFSDVASGDQEVARATAEVATILDDERAEQDPREIGDHCLQVLAEASRGARREGFTVARVGISGAMHSILAINDRDEPLTNALLWMDGRAQPEARALWASDVGPRLYSRTGTPIHAMSPLVKLLWLRRHQPETWQNTARFVSLKEWVWHRLFGVWEVDASIASATGLYNLRQGSWDAEALALTGLEPGRLSRLVPTTFSRQGIHPQGDLAAGLSASTSFTIGASDGVLANLGMDAIDPAALVLTIGTSCAVRRGSPTPYTNPASRLFCSVLDHDRFIIGAASNSGGVVLDWAIRLLDPGSAETSPGERGDLLREAGQVETNGLLFLPYVAGERAPLWDVYATGMFSGLRLHHQRAHLLRAVVEGILFNACWLAEDIVSHQSEAKGLITTGGVLHTDWIQRLAAEIFDLPVYDGSRSDASSRGAALIADIAAGQAAWPLAEPARDPVARPSAAASFKARYQEFRRVCELNYPGARPGSGVHPSLDPVT